MNRTVFYDGLYGLAVADVKKVPYETESLDAMRRYPCTGMVGFGHHNQPAGSWSDDTSMTLCVADSLCKGIDRDDMMKRLRVRAQLMKSSDNELRKGEIFENSDRSQKVFMDHYGSCGDSNCHPYCFHASLWC